MPRSFPTPAGAAPAGVGAATGPRSRSPTLNRAELDEDPIDNDESFCGILLTPVGLPVGHTEQMAILELQGCCRRAGGRAVGGADRDLPPRRGQGRGPEMEPVAPPYRVLLVDDAPAVREALRWAFEGEPDLAVAGEARDGLEATDRALALAPDVVILDLELPGRDGYAVARALAALPRPPLVVVLTVHGDPAARGRAAAAGSHGFVEKGAGWPALLAAVRRALASRTPGPPAPT